MSSINDLQLKISDKYSNRTCKLCAVLMYETSGFQQKLVNNQKKLYGFDDDAELEFIREMESAKEHSRFEPKLEDFKIETFVEIKEERLELSDIELEHINNYASDLEERVYSDYEAPPAQDSDSEDYSPTPAKIAKKSPAARSKLPVTGPVIVQPAGTTAKSNRYTEEQLEEATRAVMIDGNGIMETARRFNVPRTTLSHRIRKGPPKPRIAKPREPRVKKVRSVGVLGAKHKRILSSVPFSCDLCDFSTNSKDDLIVHMTLGHKFGNICRKCGAKFSSKEKLKEHRDRAHTQFHCPHCNLEFETRRPWNTHMVQHRREYTCEICGIQIQSHKYKYHVESHGNPQVFCPEEGCGKVFRSKAGLNYHVNNYHTTPATEVCPVCGSLYSNRKKLKRHMSRMHATPNICCTVPGCNYRSTRKEYVAMHIQKHNDIDEYTKLELVRVFKATRINNNSAPTIYAKARV